MVIETPVFKLRQGNSALVISMPHVGTYLPSWLLARLSIEAKQLMDTDWHLELLYDFLENLDATVLVATHSRYVIDLNRPPNNLSLYPGQNTTSLCPTDSFDLKPLYLAGCEPSSAEIATRVMNYWQPYHSALANELVRLKQSHGKVMLWDAHSIFSKVPRFFSGELAQLNIGTADNQSCGSQLTTALTEVLAGFPKYSFVVNGRFKGGYITRHYGNPSQDIHAVQLEIAMRSYMHEELPYTLDAQLSQSLRPVLRSLLEKMMQWNEATIV